MFWILVVLAPRDIPKDLISDPTSQVGFFKEYRFEIYNIGKSYSKPLIGLERLLTYLVMYHCKEMSLGSLVKQPT